WPQHWLNPFSVLTRPLLANVGVYIHRLALGEAVGERRNSTEAHCRATADKLSCVGFLQKDVHRSPGAGSDTEQEEDVSSPSDRFAHAITNRLIRTPKNVAAGRLRESRTCTHYEHYRYQYE